MVKNYCLLSEIYDDLMGAGCVKTYKRLIKKALGKPIVRNKSILDLGCGTGTLLMSLSKQNKTFGIDISPEMVKIAKRKDKRSVYRVMDIANFRLKRTFDIIFCAFDTINHLLNFVQWQKTFRNVHRHLKEDGFFIFDVNTPEKFVSINGKTLAKSLASGFVFMRTTSHKNRCRWDIKIFFKKTRGVYRFNKERIEEAAFSFAKIKKELQKSFDIVTAEKQDKTRIFFVCKKRSLI